MRLPNSESTVPAVPIAVFARAPVPGRVKTRLIPRLGAVGAARLHTLLMRRAVGTAIDAGVGPVSLWCAPDRAHPSFAACGAEFGVRLVTQRGGDLGERMLDALVQLCASGSAIVIGADCPALTIGELQSAAAALADGEDAVFVPAEDGGYVLVGTRRPVASLFTSMDWGGEHVMEATRDRLRRAGMRWRELATSWDVDRPSDFDRLRQSGLIAERAG